MRYAQNYNRIDLILITAITYLCDTVLYMCPSPAEYLMIHNVGGVEIPRLLWLGAKKLTRRELHGDTRSMTKAERRREGKAQ